MSQEPFEAEARTQQPVQHETPRQPSPMPSSLPQWALVACAAAAFLAFVAAFLPWGTVRLAVLGTGVSQSVDGTSAPMLGWLSLLMAFAAGTVVVLLVVRPAAHLWAALPATGLVMTAAALISRSRLETALPDAPTMALLPVSGSMSTDIGLWLSLACGLALIAAPLLGRALLRGQSPPV